MFIDLLPNNKNFLVRDEVAINNMIGNCLNIYPGERWWYPNYSCRIADYVFEPKDISTVMRVKLELSNALDFGLPFLKTFVDVSLSEEEEVINIEILWQLKSNLNVKGVFSGVI